MLDSKASGIRVNDGAVQRPLTRRDNELMLQSFLATLANFDLDFERERDLLRRSTKDPDLKLLLLRKLAKKHHERREPYVHQVQMLRANHQGERPSSPL